MSVGRFLSGLFDETKKNAESSRKKMDEQREGKKRMYQAVLMDHRSPDEGGPTNEQRDEAAKEIDKLDGAKGKDGPHSQLSGILNIVGKLRGKKPEQAEAKPQGSLPDQGSSGGPLTAGGAKDQPKPGLTPLQGGAKPQADKQAQGDPNVSPTKKNIVQRGLTKLTQGLGLAPVPNTMTPLNAGVFHPPSAEERAKAGFHTNDMTQYRKDLKEAVPSISDEQLDKAVETKFGAIPKATSTGHTFTKKGSVTGDQVPAEEKDMLGNPIDKGKSYDVLENAQGEKQYIPSTPKPDTDITREAEQPVYNPKSGKFDLFKVRSHSHSHKSAPGESKAKNGGKPPTDTTGKPVGQPGAGKGPSGASSGNRSMGDNIPIRAFGPLQKQSNAISEARNSLVGDTPDKVGGLAGDLQIFRNPESVKRVSEYIKYVNAQMEQESKAVSGGGPVAAIEWYAGLPATVSNLQAEQLRDYSKSLDGGKEDGPEHNFIANYYRLLGTWGGMRAATGASSAKWGFKNLTSEMPTPGPTTSYLEAVTRVKNMANESNVVAKNNPMVQPIDVDKLMKSVRSNGAAGGSAIDKEVEEFYKKNPTLKPKQ